MITTLPLACHIYIRFIYLSFLRILALSSSLPPSAKLKRGSWHSECGQSVLTWVVVAVMVHTCLLIFVIYCEWRILGGWQGASASPNTYRYIYIYIYRTLRWQGVSASPNIYINIYIYIYRTLRWQGVSASPNIYIFIYMTVFQF